MNKELSFDEMLDQVAKTGNEEKETIELAKEISAIIETLVDARITQGLTQRQLAKKSGIKQSAIARIERVQVIPRLDTVLRIANCLGVTITADNASTESRILYSDNVYLFPSPNDWNSYSCSWHQMQIGYQQSYAI